MRKTQENSGLQSRKRRAQPVRQTTPTNSDKPLRIVTRSESPDLLSLAQAADFLGVSQRTIQRHVRQGTLVPHSKSPGGHWRFRRVDLETFQAAVPAGRTSGTASLVLKERRERLEEVNLQLQERKTNRLLQEMEEQDARRREQEESARKDQEREARRVRLEAETANTRREREAQAEASRQEWQAEWTREILASLPPDVPPELRLAVKQAVRELLPELYRTCCGHAEDSVEMDLRAAVEDVLAPWKRRKLIEKAADGARNELPILARSFFGQMTDWEIRAKEEALLAIENLPDTASTEQMAAAARMAGRSVALEYSHQEKLESKIAGLSGALQARLLFTTSQQRAKAFETIRTAYARLPIGSSDAEFACVFDAASEPFVIADSQVRAEQEARATRARLQEKANEHLQWVLLYLIRQQADPGGWDFEGADLCELSKQISEAIGPALIEELPLDFLTGRKRVEELTDEWLSTHAC